MPPSLSNPEIIRLSNMRYKAVTTTYLEVLEGQRSLSSAVLTLAEARGTEYQSLVQLYRALGGGWQRYSVNIAPSGKADTNVCRRCKPAKSQHGLREWMEREKD